MVIMRRAKETAAVRVGGGGARDRCRRLDIRPSVPEVVRVALILGGHVLCEDREVADANRVYSDRVVGARCREPHNVASTSGWDDLAACAHALARLQRHAIPGFGLERVESGRGCCSRRKEDDLHCRVVIGPSVGGVGRRLRDPGVARLGRCEDAAPLVHVAALAEEPRCADVALRVACLAEDAIEPSPAAWRRWWWRGRWARRQRRRRWGRGGRRR